MFITADDLPSLTEELNDYNWRTDRGFKWTKVPGGVRVDKTTSIHSANDYLDYCVDAGYPILTAFDEAEIKVHIRN